MPAYARDGKVVCFFQSAHKFKSRYATFGFSDAASLDEGAMWPTAFALKELTPQVESQISASSRKRSALQGRVGGGSHKGFDRESQTPKRPCRSIRQWLEAMHSIASA